MTSPTRLWDEALPSAVSAPPHSRQTFSHGFYGLASPTLLPNLTLAFLFLSSATYVLPGLGGVGAPAQVLALGLLTLWGLSRLSASGHLDLRPQPIRWAIITYFTWIILVYAIGVTGALGLVDRGAADRSLIRQATIVGIVLYLADGLRTREQLDLVLRRLVGLAAAMAFIGAVQFATSFDPVQWLQLPGLVRNSEVTGELGRWAFSRPMSTALHPIEFGVVMAIALPVGLHYSLEGANSRQRLLHRFGTALIALAIPMAVSRSAVLGLVVGMAVLSLRWSWRRRANAAVVALIGAVGVKAAIPGLIGTIRNLIIRAPTDHSIQGRIDDIVHVKAMISASPFLGLGIGGFDPEFTFIVDNQFYGTVVTTGLTGLLLLFILIATALVSLSRISRVANNHAGHLAQALLASTLVAAVSMATFDAFFYRIFSGVFAVIIGSAGALWRFHRYGSSTMQPQARGD